MPRISLFLEKGVFERIGATGRGTRYILKGSEWGQRGQNGIKNGTKTPKRERDA